MYLKYYNFKLEHFVLGRDRKHGSSLVSLRHVGRLFGNRSQWGLLLLGGNTSWVGKSVCERGFRGGQVIGTGASLDVFALGTNRLLP